MKSTREAYGEALKEIGLDERVVVLSADLGHSTKVSEFQKEFPERFIECGISEQDIMCMAAGLSLCGKIPFVTTYAVFGAGRGWEQIRNGISYDNLNVKLAFPHAGLGVGVDGGTHQMLEDIAIMNAIPNMMIITPADANETKSMVKFAMNHKGPVYLRLYRQETPEIFDEDYEFNPKEYPILREGDKILILATGSMVATALKVAEKINATVVNVNTIKPLNKDLLEIIAKAHERIVTIEDHNILGGMGSIVAAALAENCPMPLLRIGINDRFGQTGKAEALFDFYGLSDNKIIEKINNWIEKV